MIQPRRLSFLVLPALAGLVACTDTGSGTSYYAFNNTNATVLADLNGDGKVDFVAASGIYNSYGSQPGFLSVRTQKATGGLNLPPLNYATGAGPANLAVGDLNGDGLPDIAVANADSGTVSIFFQSAASPGTFTPGPVLATTGLRPMDLAIGDLDGDGRNDLAVAASGSNNVQIFYQGATAGTFGAASPVAVTGDPQAIAIGDLDGDGKMDLAVATAGNVVSVRFQAGAFLTGPDVPVGQQPTAVKVVDLDGDGRMDILASNFGSASAPDFMGLSVALQSATTAGTFNATTPYSVGDNRSVGLAVGDLNGDGRLDVVVANNGLPGFPGSVSVLFQDPANPGLLQAPQVYGTFVGPLSVAVGDINGDGLLDIVVADGEPRVFYQSATTPGTFLDPIELYY